MSCTTALAVIPDRRPIELAEYRNAHLWSPSIWNRLIAHNSLGSGWRDDAALDALWQSIEDLPEWQQAPLVLTFDTGVIPFQAFGWAANQLHEFEARLPIAQGVSHVPTIATLIRSGVEAPLFGVWGTSITDNPFDPWDEDADEPGSGIPLGGMYVLERHRDLLPR